MEQDQVQSSTSLMWPSSGAYDAEGGVMYSAGGPPWLRQLSVLAPRGDKINGQDPFHSRYMEIRSVIFSLLPATSGR
ncbi:Cell wall alpha-1,3-glucan synthase mok12 [Gossypium arboreum]|uniref:Cell wall alpha-1,3-glucan synthase mok12 n=1 Tax=Gossypium arboreum TaxID=29729 RepID=A0A0B0PRN9_GOSAR|nr:Cell wall alpha-1,3-glucan synthase mok12 [Gossypium arboreum]